MSVKKILLFIALFEDGDVPGECMFSFQSKQSKTPSCVKKIITSQDSKNDRKMCNIRIEGKFL